jgi:hypothetical protein
VTDRRDLLRMAAFLVVLLVAVGAILLATGGGSDSKEPAAAGGTQVDGIVVDVSVERLVLRPSDGRADMEFAIRPIDRPSFDVFHLRQHAADGLLTRVTFLRDGQTLYALSAEDAPQPR